jgi:hypothetical protein
MIYAHETGRTGTYKNGGLKAQSFMYLGAAKRTTKGLFRAIKALKVLLQGTP